METKGSNPNQEKRRPTGEGEGSDEVTRRSPFLRGLPDEKSVTHATKRERNQERRAKTVGC